MCIRDSICEDDGEELSVENGDLEMLLGGIGEASFENTAAIGRLSAKDVYKRQDRSRRYVYRIFCDGIL